MEETFTSIPMLFSLLTTILHVSGGHDHFIMSEIVTSIPLLFGLIASIIHVVAGPDHLAAVSPLALNAKFRPWLIGMSWGIGHLTGMLLIGLVFFFFRDLIPIEFISNNSERIVGLLLVVIGVWALVKVVSYRKDKHAHIHTHAEDEVSAYIHKHEHSHNQSHKHTHEHDKALEKQSYWAAAGIGVIHGFAGVSHLVSMLPTLAFPNNFDAIMYLVGFGAGTIIAMVGFSFLLGLMAKTASKQRKDTVFIGINAIAGISAIFVGIIWMWNTW
ncbi:MAG: sulfite exporter TauE/SafE family protein [Bacteroidetes bacterium]|nr:sulfite exporter TauE/SafE family protein [Bacteroidota bacterium]MBL6942967.1 sulfite exporter TauE/SafE family protein [Bacteroidales bacterium]